ncbi:fungal-specific transcription factor domain-containing protein [Aspergillus pseudonomiae]|uniref:Fungal-specific transcription factor domain-containing protein n=1 Tax=Aspergillus pseudonomiae TaxID=1506151 RepID=A0A5N7CZN0_9EURO|nr:fungal-specific transcription factor domain-containing protein [Aspergillus pseudonomiae]KAE8399636.1 fungal-specific transcription factor domain-containing protein [Aspergillus pseudonomiae]
MRSQSSQWQSQAGVRATCRTCKGCRQRKVKCDGQHPKCAACRTKNQNCEHPRDGRRNVVRAKKEDIRSLQKQVEELKTQIRGQTTAEDVSRTDDIHRRDTTNHIEFGPRCPRDCTPALGCLNERGENLWPSSTSPTESDQSLQGPLTGRKETCADPSSSEGHQIQVYGATSLLPSYLEAPSANCQSKENDEDAFSRNITQDRLIAILSNIDFDGIPNRLHFMYLLTYRSVIMDSLFNSGPYMNKLLLNAIYLQSSLYTYYDRFKSLLIHYVDKPTLPTVVALLTCGACLLQYGKQSASWVYCGMAYRMITDLGYHLEDQRSSQSGEDARLSALDKEVRRRVYWGAYATDKFQSLYLGRPPGLQQSHSNVAHDFLDSYEELEEWKPYIDPRTRVVSDISVPVYPGRPSYALSTFQCLLQLSIISETIINAFYSTNDAKASEQILVKSRERVKAQLDHWRETLPRHLLFNPNTDETPPPHQMTLYTTYWTLVILTEQPFLRRGHFEFTPIPELQYQSKKRCIEASLEIRDLIAEYKKAFSLRRAQYGISYAMYGAVLVLLQHTDQDCEEYSEAIRFFWLALLKSRMCRIEKLVQRIDLDHPGATGGLASNVQLGTEPIPATEAFGQGESWNEPCLNVETDDLFFADDTIFGFFAQE